MISIRKNEVRQAPRFAVTRRLLLLGCVFSVACAHKLADVTRYYNKLDVEALLGCLGDKNAEVRAYAAGVLGETSETKPGRAMAGRVVPALIGLLHDPDVRVPGVAALALGKMGKTAEAAIPTLLEVFPEEPRERRRHKKVLAKREVILNVLGFDVPSEEEYYVIEDVSLPAAAIALQGITGIDGGRSRADWRAALHLWPQRPERDKSEPKSPNDQAPSGLTP